MTAPPVYEASPIKRQRATKAEMAARYDRLVELTDEHKPCSIRHVFYRAVVDGLPGITKNDSGYNKVQRALQKLRRDRRIPYSWIVDNSRTVFRQDTWGDADDFLYDMAGVYRRDLWRRSPYRVEIWCESDSIASVVLREAHRWRVEVFPIRGQSSDTLAYNAVEQWVEEPWRRVIVLYIGDHDPAGLEIENSLYDKMLGFADGLLHEPEFYRLGVTWEQIESLGLPGTKPKKNYGYPIAVEAEALPPGIIRDLLDDAIAGYVDHDEYATLLAVEAEEREGLERLAEAGFSS